MNYQDLVSNSSPAMVEDGMGFIKANHLSSSIFLPDSNPLKADSGLALKNHFAGTGLINFNDAKTYLATSCILHCFDGWLYLSHAVDSLLKGDRGIAIHLSYYAELRSCLSFLARQGISVNAKHHIGLGSTGIINCSKLEGTHTAAWEILDKWINSNGVNHSLLLKYFSVNGNTLFDWVNYIPYHHITPAVASQYTLDWLREWSFDVMSYKKDKESRNIVSYRPQRLIDTSQISLGSKISGIISLWRFIEPSGSDRFSLLDKYIFKILFEKIHTYLQSNHPGLTLKQLTDATFANTGRSTDTVISQIIDSGASHQVLNFSKNLTIQEPSGKLTPLTIISRALLMLRISSGAALDLLQSAGVTSSNIGFYLNPIGIDNGHWKDAAPSNFEALWDDIEESIESIEDLLADGDDITLHDCYNQYSSELNKFKQLSRACFWGTC